MKPIARLDPERRVDMESSGQRPDERRSMTEKAQPTLAQKSISSAQVRHLAASVRLEERPDSVSAKFAVFVVAASLMALIAWGSTAVLPEIAKSEGEISPRGFERAIQHPIGGTVADISVTSGQTVKRGDLIAIFSDNDIRSDLRIASQQAVSLEIRAERLAAYIEGREPVFERFSSAGPEVFDARRTHAAMLAALTDRESIVSNQLAQKKHDQQILERQIEAQENRAEGVADLVSRREELYDKGLVTYQSIVEARLDLESEISERDVLKRQLAQNLQSQREYKTRLLSTGSAERSGALQQLHQTQADLSEVNARISNLELQISQLSVRSPVDGIIKLPDRLAVGDFVSSGQAVAHVVPSDEELIARVRISARDIGRVDVGQTAKVKFTAYDFVRFGAVEGTVERISPSALVSADGRPYYTAEIRLSRHSLGPGQGEHPVLPGMRVDADIINGNRTIVEYLLKPVKLALEGAFRES
ncbi:HlyD family type I secretion periplasmic adaptor subunit [Amaricoccus macauensis]|uniref:HlyD family type I secretion periplasmic adaptor subunit n=1 Tax=Amaricoccus macauensis TaxID=57001 RepID=UPI003C7A596B